MNRERKFKGRARLYAPFILAFLVFSAVIGAEYLIVQSLIDQSNQLEIDMYHGAIGIITQRIDRYETETGASIYGDTMPLMSLINPLGMNSCLVHIVRDSVQYSDFLQMELTDGFPLGATGFENIFIETSVGKTINGDVVTLKAYYYSNDTVKELEKIASSLIIVLITMIIIAVVPGALIIESLARRSSMMNTLSPGASGGGIDVLRKGMENSSGVAFLVISPDGALMSASRSCIELLEIGSDLRGLHLGSLTVLPDTVRKSDLTSLNSYSAKSITIQSMNGSRKECIMEVHSFHSDQRIASILILFITGAKAVVSKNAETHSDQVMVETVTSRARTHLMKTAIHDMNNHISGIIGFASMEIEMSNSASARNAFVSVLDSAEKLAALCNDLQTSAVGENGRQLRDVLQEMGLVAEVLRKVLSEKVEIQVTGNCRVWIKAHRELLREFFFGLALNSTAIMNGEGRIRLDVSERIPVSGNTVEAVSPGNKVCIRYSDGYIMPVALRDILSNRNYSVSDVERQYGTTIGSGYKALIKLAGSIVFERGSGETILCLLLDGYEQKETGENSVVHRKKNQGARGISILVADEVDIVLRSVSEYLENNGMVVTRAKDGDRAMELLRKQTFDAAVLDLNMPGTSTPGIVRYCQTSIPGMAVVITTGFDAPQGIRDLLTTQSTGYLHKPHRPEDLMKMIFSLISLLKERR